MLARDCSTFTHCFYCWRELIDDVFKTKINSFKHWWREKAATVPLIGLSWKLLNVIHIVCKECKVQFTYQGPCRIQPRFYYKLKTYLFLALLPLLDPSNLLYFFFWLSIIWSVLSIIWSALCFSSSVCYQNQKSIDQSC